MDARMLSTRDILLKMAGLPDIKHFDGYDFHFATCAPQTTAGVDESGVSNGYKTSSYWVPAVWVLVSFKVSVHREKTGPVGGVSQTQHLVVQAVGNSRNRLSTVWTRRGQSVFEHDRQTL
jgi:hypothetical protein